MDHDENPDADHGAVPAVAAVVALGAVQPKQSTYELVYEKLRRAVLDGTIAGGSRLVELELAEQLAVSRTPVREALRRLESDGFAQRVSGRGLVVTPSGPDDIGDIALLRVEIEGLAARLAAQRASKADWDNVAVRIEAMRRAKDATELSRAHLDVHRCIYALGFSPRMSGFFENHLLAYIEVSVSVGPGFEAEPEASYRQHVQLLAALSSGNIERAVRAAREHADAGARFARRPEAVEGDGVARSPGRRLRRAT